MIHHVACYMYYFFRHHFIKWWLDIDEMRFGWRSCEYWLFFSKKVSLLLHSKSYFKKFSLTLTFLKYLVYQSSSKTLSILSKISSHHLKLPSMLWKPDERRNLNRTRIIKYSSQIEMSRRIIEKRIHIMLMPFNNEYCQKYR